MPPKPSSPQSSSKASSNNSNSEYRTKRGLDTIRLAWLAKKNWQTGTETKNYATSRMTNDTINKRKKSKLSFNIKNIVGIDQSLRTWFIQTFAIQEALSFIHRSLALALKRVYRLPKPLGQIPNIPNLDQQDAEERKEITDYRTNKRKREEDEAPVKKRQKLSGQGRGLCMVRKQSRAEARQALIDELLSRLRTGKTPRRTTIIRPSVQKLDTVSRHLSQPSIIWFAKESSVPVNGQPQVQQENLDAPLRRRSAPTGPSPNTNKLVEFRKEVLGIQGHVDSCIKRQHWSDLDTPQSGYVLLRKQIIEIARLFYGSAERKYQSRLRKHDDTMAQVVREAISASRLMESIILHFFDGPAFAISTEDEQHVLQEENSIFTNHRTTTKEKRSELLKYHQEYIIYAYNIHNFTQLREQRIKTLAARIQEHMQPYQARTTTYSPTLMALLQSTLNSLCVLAFNWIVITKTSICEWQVYDFPVGDAISIDFVSVVGDINGAVCYGDERGCRAALTVAPALFRARSEESRCMVLMEKAWIVIERLWEIP